MFCNFIILYRLFSAKKYIPLHYMTKQQVKISFIITDYNLPIALLRECIESILALDINAENREIILVDDGSDDSPESELSDLMPKITYIRQENKGLSVARNVGIQASKGEYIQFVDGDDCLLPVYNDCISSVVGNDFDMLFFGRVSENKSVFRGKAIRKGSGVEYLRNNNLQASAWGYIFKKELLGDDLRFTPAILHEDEEFTPLLCLRAKNVGEYSGSAYFYRVREDSIVHSPEKEHLNRRINDFIGVIVRLNSKLELLDDKGKSALSRRINQITMDLVYNIILITRSKQKLQETLSYLKDSGLAPLPIRLYTIKYFAFSLLAKTRLGRSILFKVIRK